MTKLFLLSGLCFLFSCAPKPADDCQFTLDVYGKKIKHKKIPVVLYVSVDVPHEYFEIMQESVAEINKNRELLVLYRGDVVAGPRQRNLANEVYFNSNWEDDRKSEQGRTNIWWTMNSGIQETDVLFNSDDFNFAEGKVSFKTLATHEFLHVLGLKHQEDDKHGIMYPYLPYYEQRGVTDREYKNLECVYGK